MPTFLSPLRRETAISTKKKLKNRITIFKHIYFYLNNYVEIFKKNREVADLYRYDIDKSSNLSVQRS